MEYKVGQILTSMSDTVKSIFRQREVEKLYELKYYGTSFIFSTYVESDVGLSAIANEDKILSDKIIGTYDIIFPMLEIGDEIFLHDIQETVKVKNRMRSDDGSIIYYVEDKVLETENTKKSYAECREKIEHYKYEKEKFDNLESRLNSCKEEFEKYKREYKYKHRFFNFV